MTEPNEESLFPTPIHVKRFLYEELNFCGCFEFEPVLQELKRVLEWCDADISMRASYETLYPNNGIFYLIFSILGKKELIGHGTSIRHPWLYDRGKDMLRALNLFTPQEIEDCEGELDGTTWG